MTSLAPPPTFGGVVAPTEPTPHRGFSVRAMLLIGAAALAVLGVCAWLGVVKFDEGWYVVSSRLAAQGSLPYRDFAFTQGPLLAYALAPAQWIAPGIMSARIASSLFAAIGIVLVLVSGRRLGGKRAALFTGLLLLCAFPALPYWLAETKTYGLASLFLAATVAALTWPIDASVRLPMATAAAACFGLSRTSGATLSVIVFAYCAYTAPDLRTWKRVMAVAAALALPFVVLLGYSGDRGLWNLYQYHQMTAYWANPHTSTFLGRVSELFTAWPFVSFLVLFVIGLVAITRDRSVWRSIRAHPELLVVIVGMAAFVVTHMLGGAFFAEEYVAPLIPTVVMLCVVAILRLRESLPLREMGVVAVALVLALVFTPRTGYLGAPGWKGAPAAYAPLTSCIEQHSKPGDRVFALVLLEAVPAARRTPVAGSSIGVFSYEDVSTERAEHLHILNADLVQRAIADPSTSVVVLSNVDRQLLSFRGWFSQDHQDIRPIDRELAASYRPVCAISLTRELQGQPVDATVYARTS